MTVAALFVRPTSHYKSMPGVDAYDFRRDALTWRGGCPGVFHPPCRGWGKLRGMSKHPQTELELARWSMRMVREFGGVVEHPASSGLWRDSDCLGYGIRDDFGGVLIPVFQSWFGHRAAKITALYMVGCEVPSLFDISRMAKSCATVPVEKMCRAERERTPPEFAEWLVNLAASCEVPA